MLRVEGSKTMRTLLAAILCLPVLAQKPDVPNAREQNDLVKQFFAADGGTAEGWRQQRAILDQLANVPPLDDARVRAWEKTIDALLEKGREIEGSGDHWFFDNSRQKRKRGEPIVRRGRYLVGGTTKKPKGLLIAMHGGGAGSGDADSAAAAYDAPAGELGWLMIAPEVLEKTEYGWTDAGTEEFVLQLVDAALRTHPTIDRDRVYFAGHSMGGYGSWMLGAHHADRVAAIAPSAGAPTPILGRGDRPLDIVEGVIPNLRNVFVSVYQSTDDVQVPPAANQSAVGELKKAKETWGGFEFDYWEVADQGHGPPPGGYLAQLEKIADKAREPVPERIVWQPVLDWKRQFHWLWWELPSRDALVVADRDRAANTIAITSKTSTQDLWVLLDDRVVDHAKEVVVTVNGTETFRGIAQPTLDALLVTSAHPDPKLRFCARVPAFARQ